jgi:hypothetical protein
MSLKGLAEGWCDRRALAALHYFLPGYFAFLGLNDFTDGLGALETALKDVLVHAKSDVTLKEKKEVKRVIVLVHDAMYYR